jgi:outer membrane immunogenic protein
VALAPHLPGICSTALRIDGPPAGGSLSVFANAGCVALRLGIKTSLCVGTAALALVSASAELARAVAADLSIAPIYKAPTAAIQSWAGSYIGIAGGGAWGGAALRNNATGADQSPTFNLSGGIIGMTSGFNVQGGNGMLGFEGDISALDKKGSALEFPPNAAFSNEVREKWLATFRGRIGYARDNWLIYATVGGALATVANKIVAPVGAISDQQWHWGWTAGGGVEVKINQDWSAKVEYLYVGLQDKSYFNPAPSPLFPSNQRLHLDDHIVRVGVNYKLPWNVLDSFFKR